MNKTFTPLVAFCLTLLISCGGGGGGTTEVAPELLRVLHAAPDAPALTVTLNNEPFAAGLIYGEATDYDSAPEGTVQVEVKSEESVLPLIDSEQTIASGKEYSVILYEEAAGDTLNLILQEDTNTAPAEEEVRLRVGDLAPSLSTADVYIVRPGVSVRNSSPVRSGLAFKSFSDYFDLDAGDYEIKCTEAGTKNVVAESGIVTLEPGEVRTFYVLDRRGGGEPYQTRMLVDRSF